MESSKKGVERSSLKNYELPMAIRLDDKRTGKAQASCVGTGSGNAFCNGAGNGAGVDGCFGPGSAASGGCDLTGNSGTPPQ